MTKYLKERVLNTLFFFAKKKEPPANTLLSGLSTQSGSISSGRDTDTTKVPTQVERCMDAGLDLIPIILFGSGSEAFFCPAIIFLYVYKAYTAFISGLFLRQSDLRYFQLIVRNSVFTFLFTIFIAGKKTHNYT